MKVLSIGNSFSQDAQKYLHNIALADGYQLDCVNLMIGGCSLERHYNNMISDAKEYSFELNGAAIGRMVSLSEALSEDKYDVVTVQQVSQLSGRPQSYIPYVTALAEYVRKMQPEAKLYFHRTWSYEWGYVTDRYVPYNSDQEEMYRRICDATLMASKLVNAELIPSGDAIQRLRALPEFDYRAGGMSLCRDGFHMSLDYGRFAVGVVWYHTLTGNVPSFSEFGTLSSELVVKIISTVTAD